MHDHAGTVIGGRQLSMRPHTPVRRSLANVGRSSSHLLTSEGSRQSRPMTQARIHFLRSRSWKAAARRVFFPTMPFSSNENLRAFVLCGGLGSRLRDTVPDRPKPMALVGGVPFLLILLNALKQQGVSQFVLGTGHMAEK